MAIGGVRGPVQPVRRDVPRVDTVQPVFIDPAIQTLVITGFAPDVLLPVLVTPPTLALVITGYAPTLTVSTPAGAGATGGAGYYYPQEPIRIPRVKPQPVLVAPGTLQLRITGYPPTIWITRTIITFAPVVTVTQYINTTDIMTLFAQGVLTAQEAATLLREARKDTWSGSQYRLLEAGILQE